MVCMILIAVAFLAMMIVAIVKDWTQPASYSVAIDSVAGLDPETDLPRDTLNPEFNLTLRLASQRADMGVCFEAGTTVAASCSPALCAGPRPSAEEESVVAWGRGVPVPRLARDRLAGDLRGGGAAEFDVTLTVQRYTYAESWDVVLCSGKVGDAAALITPCSLYDENVQEPSLEPGYGGYSSQPESPPETGDDDQDQIRRLLRCSSGIAIAVLVVVGVLVLCELEASKARRLSVAVATVSGLVPATDLARPAVDPQFNLTLRIASRSLLSRACVGVSSTAVAVSYHGVRLASAPVAPRVCAARRKSADTGPFVAWGSSVRLPGFARDSLAADMRNGAAAFDVALMDGHLVVCRGRRVGDADALQAPCVLTHVETDCNIYCTIVKVSEATNTSDQRI
uniref:Late embryogenesis abundant protein LEA-2 subgroup domain-containing protein n=1 Tax=Oryza meridionalis TaxID=40149 RepID=A0A0E0CNH9_9ORYZ